MCFILAYLIHIFAENFSIKKIQFIMTAKKSEKVETITLTTLCDKVNIFMAGSGAVTIDWGDGSKIEKRRLSKFKNDCIFGNCFDDGRYYYPTDNDRYTFRHNYSFSRTIIITGKNITYLNCVGNQLTDIDVNNCSSLVYLDCSYNQLTSLDVSKNTRLVKLYCYRNELTRMAIDALFDTLHGYPAEEQKLVSVVDNPGQDDCNKSIAKNKGWSVGLCFHEVLSRSIFKK